MNPQRLEFLKKLIRFFRQNPQANHFRGITKEDCLSFLAHHLSQATPGAALDPQDPNILNQAQRQVDLYEQRVPQRSSPSILPRAPASPQAAQQQPAQPQQPQKSLSQAEIMEELKNHVLGKKKLSQRELEKHFEAVAKHYFLQKFPFLQRAANIKNAVFGLPGKTLGWGWKKLAAFTATPRAKIGGAIRTVFSLPKKAVGLTGKGLIMLTAYPRAKIAAAVRKVVSLPGRALSFGKQKLSAIIAAPQSFIKTKISAVKGRITAFSTKVKTKVKMAAGSVERTIYTVPGVKTLGTGITKTGKAFSRAGGAAVKVAKAPLKFVGKVVGFAGKVLGKVVAPVLLVKAAIDFNLKLIKKTLKYIGIPLLAIYMLMAFLGSSAFIGAVIGGVVGGIAGGIAGAIIGLKLGAVLMSPLLLIPVVGPVLYAIAVGTWILGGAIFGAFAGAAILALVGGYWGYMWEKSMAPVVQNLWTGAGNLLGGVGNALTGAWTAYTTWVSSAASALTGAWTATGNFLGGLWTGAKSLWAGAGNALTGASTSATTWASGAASNLSIGAANLASSAFSAAGSAITATGGAISGFVNALSSISLAQSATVPVLGAVGVAGGFTLFVGPMIVGTGFMREPVPEGIPPVVSEYIALTKTAQPALLLNSDVEGAGKYITYTITIGAPKATLINVRVTEQTIKATGSTITEITGDSNGNSILSWTFPQINQGQTEIITYQIHADDSFKNSTITNSVTVLADVPSANKLNETKVARAVVNITGSLIAGSCGICNTTQGSFEWRKLLTEAGTAYQVPGALLAGISRLETGVPWGYTDAQVIAYSAPGVSMVPCPTSIDGARGAFQFMPGTWEAYKNAAIDKGARPPGYTPNICNLLDAAYAAAAKLAYDVTTIRDASVCGDGGSELVDPTTGACLVPVTIPSSCGWTQQNVYHSAAHYLGMCVDPRFPSITYCRTVYYTYYVNWQCP